MSVFSTTGRDMNVNPSGQPVCPDRKPFSPTVAIFAAIAWQFVPWIFMLCVFEEGYFLPFVLFDLLVLPAIAGAIHRSKAIALAVFTLPIVVAGIGFLAFAALVIVPPGQHP